MSHQQTSVEQSEWFEEIFDCFTDPCNCCLTCCCPCVTYAQNGKLLLETEVSACQDCCTFCCGCCGTATPCNKASERRRVLRMKYNLPEAPCSDSFMHHWLHYCALCQEHRELKARAAIALPPVQDLPISTPQGQL